MTWLGIVPEDSHSLTMQPRDDEDEGLSQTQQDALRKAVAMVEEELQEAKKRLDTDRPGNAAVLLVLSTLASRLDLGEHLNDKVRLDFGQISRADELVRLIVEPDRLARFRDAAQQVNPWLKVLIAQRQSDATKGWRNFLATKVQEVEELIETSATIAGQAPRRPEAPSAGVAADHARVIIEKGARVRSRGLEAALPSPRTMRYALVALAMLVVVIARTPTGLGEFLRTFSSWLLG